MNESKILKFIKKEREKKSPHTFSKWKEEIYFLKDKNVELQIILKYIFEEDPFLRKKYAGRVDTARALLSAFIKKYYKKDEKNFIRDSKKTIIKTIEDSSSEKVKDEVVKEKFLDNEGSILIEHIDGSNGNYKHDYLMSECVCKSGSSKKFDLVEKNFIVIPSVRQKVIYYFEKVKSDIREGKYELKDYELVIHINIEKDSGLDVYRYYNGELIFIEEVHSFDAGHLDDILEFGIEKFIGMHT